MLVLIGCMHVLYTSPSTDLEHIVYLSVNIFLNTYHRLIVNFVNRTRPHASRDLVRRNTKETRFTAQIDDQFYTLMYSDECDRC